MEKKIDLSYLLRVYSMKQSSSQFDLLSFCTFLHKYSQHYLNDKPELEKYISIGTEALSEELKDLKNAGHIEFNPEANGKIVVFRYYIDKMKKTYKSMLETPATPFPAQYDIPAGISAKFVKRIDLESDFMEIEQSTEKNEFIYALTLNSGLPIMLFPSSFSPDMVLDFSLAKLRAYLSNDESYDYVYKRLKIANPGKEFSIKAFIGKIQSLSNEAVVTIKEAGENYLMWGQICTFIRNEFDKKAEKLADEISLLQGISIIEYVSSYYRNKAQKNLQRDTALKNLNLALQKYPYYFSLTSISKFKDSRGVPLLGQYDQSDLQDFIDEKTSQSPDYTVPDLLIFKTPTGDSFFVLTEKVIPLIISLANEKRKSIQKACIQRWKSLMMNFEQEDAMKNDKDFETLMQTLVKEKASNLYGLLSAQFLKSVAADPKIKETQAIECSRIFPQGNLAKFKDILVINRGETLRDTKILLPFWYTIPIISTIISFFRKPKKKKSKKDEKEKKVEKKTGSQSKKDAAASIKESAEDILKILIPEGLTMEAALKKNLDSWNQNLNKNARDNLTEDVNSLIRDYLRKIQRNLKASTFTVERVRELAAVLVSRPNFIDISDKDALQKYTELYLLSLINKFF